MNIPNAIKYNVKHAADVTPDTAAFAELVASHQRAQNLSADGQLGPATRATLPRRADVAKVLEDAAAEAARKAANTAALRPISAADIDRAFAAPRRPASPLIKLVDWIPGLTIDDVEARWIAMSKIVGLAYALGSGGRDPRAADPRTTGKRGFGIDCTGALCHGFAIDRYQPELDAYGGWCSSDGIVEDALGKQELWELLERPVRGCAIVFPGIDFDGDGDRERIGHGAWVRKAPATWDPKRPAWANVEIFDCAGSNSKRAGAVGDVFNHDASYFYGKHTYRDTTREKWGSIAVWCKAIGRP